MQQPDKQITASVGEPMPIPERPEMYLVMIPTGARHPRAAQWRVYASDAPYVNRDDANAATGVPGSFVVTIPATTPPTKTDDSQPKPEPESVSGPIPWPDDLTTLVGKKITTRAKPRRNCCDIPQPMDVLAVSRSRAGIKISSGEYIDFYVNPDHRDLLSVEDVAPASPPSELPTIPRMGGVTEPINPPVKESLTTQQSGESEEVEKWKQIAQDLHVAYINKDPDCPHKFETDAVAAYLALKSQPPEHVR